MDSGLETTDGSIVTVTPGISSTCTTERSDGARMEATGGGEAECCETATSGLGGPAS